MRLRELRMDWRSASAIVISTLTLVVEHYRQILPLEVYDRVLLYLIVPLAVVVLVFRERPAHYGFALGDWRAGLALTLAACAGLAAVMAAVARTGDFRAYYASWTRPPLGLVLHTALDLVGWEFLFRGFLLFALYRACGPLALILQAVPFTIAHFGKPELETLSCIFGGTALGYVAWRTRSFLYPFLIHWFLATFTVLVAGGALG
jgi:membrane protease YdiL (CAAX protease family)